MTDTFRRVPYAPDPQAEPYWAADAHALTKSVDEATRIKFAWFFVDNRAKFSEVADAWTAFS